MALETTVYDAVDYMTEPEDVFHHLEAEFELYEPKYLLMGLADCIRARGGVERMASETGIPVNDLTEIGSMDEASVRKLSVRVMEAYRPKDSSASRVA